MGRFSLEGIHLVHSRKGNIIGHGQIAGMHDQGHIHALKDPLVQHGDLPAAVFLRRGTEYLQRSADAVFFHDLL